MRLRPANRNVVDNYQKKRPLAGSHRPGVVVSSLALQTAWLLPVLQARTELIIQGQTPPPSVSHTIYVVLEVIKAVSLIVYGFWKVLKRKT